MTAQYETVNYEKRGRRAIVTLNRPDHRNAITGLMMHELVEVLMHAAADEELLVLLLTGAGNDFCPGADLRHYTTGDARKDKPLTDREFLIPTLLHEMNCVTVAAIHGACAGAGLGWAAACDLRFASESARFNTAFLDVAVAGDMGLPWSLPRLLGASKARELSFLPHKFDAQEAERIGLVSRVFEHDDFGAEIEGIVERLAGSAPLALRNLKKHYVEAERIDFGDFISLEAERHMRIFQSEDTREAFSAYLEKRKPDFKGR